MKVIGENLIPAPLHVVWRALNDADVLRRSIPGCESLEKLSDDRLQATVATRLGPMPARFTGEVTLSDLDPPNGYTLSGSGNGGALGTASGAARVRLAAVPEGTRLTYDVDAAVTGKLAQMGARVIETTARTLAGQFFDRFSALVAAGQAAPEDAALPVAARGSPGALPVVLGGAAIVAAIAAAMKYL